MERNQPKLPPQVYMALQEVTLHFRRRLRVRGLLRFGLATLVILAVGTVLLTLAVRAENETARNAIIVASVLCELIAAWRGLVRPHRMPIPLKEVALYIDHKYPDLENRIVSALEFARRPGEGEGPGNRGAVSLWMIERLLDETNTAARALPVDGAREEWYLATGRLTAGALVGAAMVVLFLYGTYWTPRIPLPGFSASRPFEEAPFQVKPGDIEVRRGENVVVLAEAPTMSQAFAIAWRTADGEWETEPMGTSTGARVHHYELRNVQENLEYRVQAGRHRSPTYTVTAWEPPRVENIHLTYQYPEYLGRPAEDVPNGGPISAVEGTRVAIRASVNKALDHAELVLESGRRVPLEAETDAVWAGELLVDANDKYHIEVLDRQGRPSDYEPVYDITAVKDKAPEVRIAFPRGDDEVTPVEEIPFAVEVKDDFGVAAVGIQYEVAGRDPVRVTLADSASSDEAAPTAAHGEHLLMLEDLGLAPGDLVTWTVWTADQKPDRDPYETLGDPYFLEVRPFQRTFEEAISNAGAGQQQMGGAGGSESTMGQREILIATWNLRRRAGEMDRAEFYENRNKIVDAQTALLENGQSEEGGAHPLFAPGGPAGEGPEADDLQQRLVRAQESAVEALKRAEWPEPAGPLSEAMVHEQEAYSLLKKLEPERSSIQQAQANASGQGGQGSSGNRREIQGLELARNRNFYEEEQTTRPPGQEATEQARQSLEELTQRQQVANDEMARLISELQKAETEEERRELERRLKRLEEELERNLERLDELAAEMASGNLDPEQAREARQGLEQARREMNRSLEEVREERLQQARAAGSRATDALEETRREMAGLSGAATAAGLRELRERMAQLEERQESILDRLERLKERERSQALDDLADQREEQDNVLEEKTQVADDLRDLMENAGELAQGAQQNQSLVARKLNDWLRETSGTGLLDNMRETEPLVNHGIWDAALEREAKVLEELQTAQRRLEEVEDLLVEDEVDSLRLALRQLQNVLEPPADRPGAAESPENGEAGEASAEPRPGEEGEGTPQNEATPQNNAGGAQPPSEQTDSPGEPGRSGAAGQPQDNPEETRAEAGGGDQPGEEPRESGGGGPGGRRDRAQRDGSGRGYGGYYGPDDIEQFVESDYGRWLEAIRNAEDLLPETPVEAGRAEEVTPQQRLARAREAINEMRRDYRGSGVAPKYEGFLERVAAPVEEAAAEIDRRLQELLQEKEFVLDPRVGVPPQYQDEVAEYFRALSEAEAARS